MFFWKKPKSMEDFVRKLLLAAVLAFSGSAYADDCCDPCGGWNAHVDYLYWTVRNCQMDYAVPYDDDDDDGLSIGSVKSVHPSYESGVRIGAHKDCGCFTYGIDYTWYRSDTTSTVIDTDGHLAGSYLVDDYTELSQGDIDLARGIYDLDYDVVDLIVGYDLCSGECFDLSMFGGLKFAFIDQELETLYSSSTTIEGESNNYDQANLRSNMDAYGLQFGVNSDYNIWRCVDLYGLFSFDLFAANFDRSFKYITTTDGGSTTTTHANLTADCWDIVSAINLGVGLKYHVPNCYFKCVDATLSIGYEFHQWLNHPGFMKYTNESGEITFDHSLQSLSFDGLVISLDARF